MPRTKHEKEGLSRVAYVLHGNADIAMGQVQFSVHFLNLFLKKGNEKKVVVRSRSKINTKRLRMDPLYNSYLQ
jgi:hypothetical protein